ncbi:MAG TPA: ubiquinol oxidase subunit II [Burkholderiales bacterium]|nr:ubiquinol oxidase subunit II [Burkholderiales bacterium]
MLSGCSSMPLLDPKGPIGSAELSDIGIAFGLMLIVVIPVIFMALWFPRKYSASRARDDYDPKWSRSATIDLVVWLIPSIIVAALGALAWKESHRLDPFMPIDPGTRPIHIEVVSLDWKWLFIYPDQHVAAVDRLVLPVHVPVSFRITSGSVMSSFFIPRLGSQIYAMAGMQTRLHLLADETGIYSGQNQQYSGRGYADMHFKVVVTSMEDFKNWLKSMEKSPEKLDFSRYLDISRPGTGYKVAAFSGVKAGLFEEIIESARKPERP